MSHFKISTRVYASRTPERKLCTLMPIAVYTDCRLLRMDGMD